MNTTAATYSTRFDGEVFLEEWNNTRNTPFLFNGKNLVKNEARKASTNANSKRAEDLASRSSPDEKLIRNAMKDAASDSSLGTLMEVMQGTTETVTGTTAKIITKGLSENGEEK